MTAKVFSLVSSIFLNRTCTPMLPPINNGINVRLMRNAFVRTAARYSRSAMTSTLRMMVLLAGRPGDANENVLQGGSRQLEVPHGAARHERGQNLFRIR